MNKIIEILRLVEPYLGNIWIFIGSLLIITIVPFLLFLIFYKLSNKFINDDLDKVYSTVIITVIVCFILYILTFLILDKFLFNELGLINCLIASAILLSITLIIQVSLLIIIYVVRKVYLTILKIKIHKKIKVSTTDDKYILKDKDYDNITLKVSKFTSNYIKSFIRPGITINRVQILKDNKEDYINKVSDLCVSNNPEYDIDSNAAGEFYYNYYIKSWSK